MQLSEGYIYHVFNRGNNRQPIFFYEDNYHHFLKCIQKTIAQCCDILCWCLIPNHFHFLIHANATSIIEIKDGSFARQQFSQGIKQLLSSYTKSINSKMDFTGSLFQQKTKAICVMNNQLCFGDTTFHYIHQNPYKAGLVKRMEEWEFSSFKDYIGLRDEQLCNRQMAFEYLDLDVNTIYQDSYNVINDPELIKLIESGGVLHPGGVGHPQIPTGLYQTIHKRN